MRARAAAGLAVAGLAVACLAWAVLILPASAAGGFDGFHFDRESQHGARQPGVFAFYVLSLSWAPSFCASRSVEGDAPAKDECAPGAARGFVVHGLWPQDAHGYPTDCGGGSPSFRALDETRGVYPSEGLARYEWRKHGTCSGLSPAEYFRDVKDARAMVTIPPRFVDPHEDQRLSTLDVERAFTDANPRLRPGMLAATCSRGMLEEVRICFSKDLQAFQPCPEVVRERCRGGSLDVPPAR